MESNIQDKLMGLRTGRPFWNKADEFYEFLQICGELMTCLPQFVDSSHMSQWLSPSPNYHMDASADFSSSPKSISSSSVSISTEKSRLFVFSFFDISSVGEV